MRVAYLLISHLRAKSEMRSDVRLKDRPAVIVDRSSSAPLVVDHTSQSRGNKGRDDIGAGCLPSCRQHRPGSRRDLLPAGVSMMYCWSLADISHRVEGPELGTAELATL